jgi:hypothetical protein
MAGAKREEVMKTALVGMLSVISDNVTTKSWC